MPYRDITKDSTSLILKVFLRDSTTGLGKTGVAAASMSGDYVKDNNAADVALSFSTGAVADAYSSGKWAEVGNGYYLYHFPDLCWDTFGETGFSFRATNAIDAAPKYRIVAMDSEDAVRLGLTALPNAAADAAGGLPISDAGGLDLDAKLSVATSALATPTNITAGTITTVSGNVTGSVGSVVGHTAQTGDSFGLIGTAGIGLTNLGGSSNNWNTVTPDAAGTVTGYATEAKQDIIDANIDTLLTRITSTLFSGITSLAEWLGLMAGNQTANATALTEIKATGAGSGTYDESTDSQEAIAGAGGGGAPTVEQIRTEMDSNSTQLSAIVADTNELQTNQGNWLTATGFSTHSAANVVTAMNLPTNFSSMNINGSGAVDAMVQGYIDGILFESGAGSIASNVTVFFDNAGATTSQTVDDVGSGGGSAPTAAAVADAVWDELLSGHVVSGSAGEALAAAGTAGDPWITPLPGSYTGSQAGALLAAVPADTIALLLSSIDKQIVVRRQSPLLDRVTNHLFVLQGNDYLVENGKHETYETLLTGAVSDYTIEVKARGIDDTSVEFDGVGELVVNADGGLDVQVGFAASELDDVGEYTWSVKATRVTGGHKETPVLGFVTIHPSDFVAPS